MELLRGRVATAVVAACLVSAATIVLVDTLARQGGGTRLGATLRWWSVRGLGCGDWPSVDLSEALPTNVDARDDFALQCSVFSASETQPGETSADACAAWCAAKGAGTSQWCCELTLADDGSDSARCRWTDGLAVLASVDVPTLAFSSCPSPGAPSVPKASTPYECPSWNMHDALKLDGDGPGTCSQICLPHGLWHAAQDHGVERGRCAERGCGRFAYATAMDGVAYNLYTCAARGAAPPVAAEPPCGSWPDAPPTGHAKGPEPAVLACAGYSSREVMEASTEEFTTQQMCAEWCEARHPSAARGAWCCELSSGADGTTCAWADGAPALVPAADVGGIESVAYAKCPAPAA